MKKNVEKIEVREVLNFSEEGEVKKITGTIPYMKRSYDLGGFVEQIAPTAFNKTVSDIYNVKLLVNHDTSKVISSVKSNTLVLRNTETGLEFESIVPNVSYALDAYEIISKGIVDTLSFGFRVIKDNWEVLEDGTNLRTIIECKLEEISIIVAFPAYEDTSSEVRGINLDILASTLSKDTLGEVDYFNIQEAIKKLNTLIPEEEKREEVVEITQADDESLSADETRKAFLELLLRELKK